jgi:hypothetical protein
MAAASLFLILRVCFNNYSLISLKPQRALSAERIRVDHRTSIWPSNPRLKRIVISCRGAIAARIPVAHRCPCEGLSKCRYLGSSAKLAAAAPIAKAENHNWNVSFCAIAADSACNRTSLFLERAGCAGVDPCACRYFANARQLHACCGPRWPQAGGARCRHKGAARPCHRPLCVSDGC